MCTNLLQTLRARLTTVEGKLVEKEFEIKRLIEENDSLKETVENLSRLTVGKSDGESGFQSLKEGIYKYGMMNNV